jgi:2-isopropylmalate synthase
MSGAESPATGAPVLIDTTDGARTWCAMGVSENIIEGSWHALSDSMVDGLLHAENQE